MDAWVYEPGEKQTSRMLEPTRTKETGVRNSREQGQHPSSPLYDYILASPSREKTCGVCAGLNVYLQGGRGAYPCKTTIGEVSADYAAEKPAMADHANDLEVEGLMRSRCPNKSLHAVIIGGRGRGTCLTFSGRCISHSLNASTRPGRSASIHSAHHRSGNSSIPSGQQR